MDLSTYIEQNITVFLDKKSEDRREVLNKVRSEESSLFSVERDYARETQDALERNNLGEAKRIFDDLRDNYNTLQKDSDEREKVYYVLQEVYAIIKEYFSKNSNQTLEDEIKRIEQKGLETNAPVRSTKGEVEHHEFDKKLEQEQAVFAREALRARQERERLDTTLLTCVQSVNDCLGSEDLVGAVKQYRKLKELFSTYPSDNKFRKIEWYNNVLSLYEQIRQLQQRLKRVELKGGVVTHGQQSRATTIEAVSHATEHASSSQKSEAGDQKREQHVVVAQLENRESLKRELKVAIDLLQQGDIHGCESQVMSVKHRLRSMPESETKNMFEHVISQLTSKIEFARRSHERSKDDVASLFEQGVRAEQEHQEDIARSLYMRVLKMNPDHSEAKKGLERLKQR